MDPELVLLMKRYGYKPPTTDCQHLIDEYVNRPVDYALVAANQRMLLLRCMDMARLSVQKADLTTATGALCDRLRDQDDIISRQQRELAELREQAAQCQRELHAKRQAEQRAAQEADAAGGGKLALCDVEWKDKYESAEGTLKQYQQKADELRHELIAANAARRTTEDKCKSMQHDWVTMKRKLEHAESRLADLAPVKAALRKWQNVAAKFLEKLDYHRLAPPAFYVAAKLCTANASAALCSAAKRARSASRTEPETAGKGDALLPHQQQAANADRAAERTSEQRILALCSRAPRAGCPYTRWAPQGLATVRPRKRTAAKRARAAESGAVAQPAPTSVAEPRAADSEPAQGANTSAARVMSPMAASVVRADAALSARLEAMTQHHRALSPLKKTAVVAASSSNDTVAASAPVPARQHEEAAAAVPKKRGRPSHSDSAPKAISFIVAKPPARVATSQESAKQQQQRQLAREQFLAKRQKVLAEAVEAFHELLAIRGEAFIEPLPDRFEPLEAKATKANEDAAVDTGALPADKETPACEAPADCAADKEKEPAAESHAVADSETACASASKPVTAGGDADTSESESTDGGGGPSCIVADERDTKAAKASHAQRKKRTRKPKVVPPHVQAVDAGRMNVDQASMYFNRTVNAMCVAGLGVVLDKKWSRRLDETHMYVRELDSAWRQFGAVDAKCANATLAQMAAEFVETVANFVGAAAEGDGFAWTGDAADATALKRFCVLLVVLSRLWHNLCANLNVDNHAARHELQKDLDDMDETVQVLHELFHNKPSGEMSKGAQTAYSAACIAREKMKVTRPEAE